MDFDWNAASAIGTVAAAGVAAYAAWAAGRIATKDRQAAIKAQESASQPFVWVDFRVDNQATFFQVLVKNEGPTIARNVRVLFDPPLASSVPDWGLVPEFIASMPPGRVLGWRLDTVWNRLGETPLPTRYQVTITGDGPYGPLEPNEYTLDLRDYMESATRPATEAVAMQNEIRQAAQTVAKAINDAAPAKNPFGRLGRADPVPDSGEPETEA